jgi:hypothetical protein
LSATKPEAYGFTEKTAQSENQQTQTAQEAAAASPQEAHLAEVTALPDSRPPINAGESLPDSPGTGCFITCFDVVVFGSRC